MSEEIYHLVPAQRWRNWPTEQGYLPAEYERDGFIHCTAGRDLLLYVANRFYRTLEGEALVLAIDPQRLRAELRWEPGSHGEATLFPHLYGPLNQDAVIAVHALRRDAAGRFEGF